MQGSSNILPAFLDEGVVSESSQESHMPNLQAAIEEDLRSTHEEELHQEPVDLSVILPWEGVKEKVTKEETPSPSKEPDMTIKGDRRTLRIPFARAYNIYHCVIVPRSSQQFLTRELGDQAAALIRRHHQMNGWELSHLTIRPQYAMWTVHLPVPNDPVKVVEEIKAETSELFTSTFPEQAQLLAGQSFWAQGYWILSGNQPPSGSLIRQFLKFNRQEPADRRNESQ
jgi:REP element-mobilizing transposase RayT